MRIIKKEFTGEWIDCEDGVKYQDPEGGLIVISSNISIKKSGIKGPYVRLFFLCPGCSDFSAIGIPYDEIGRFIKELKKAKKDTEL